MLVVAVTGGRDYTDIEHVWSVLSEVNASMVLQGGQRGADWLAVRWGRSNGRQVVTYEYVEVGRSGGPVRNKNMIRHGKPDMLIAFPGGRGTANCVHEAKSAGVPIRDERK